MRKIILAALLTFFLSACSQNSRAAQTNTEVKCCEQEQCNKKAACNVIVGAERTYKYLPLLADKRVAIMANQTSVIGDVHLVDSLHRMGVNIVGIFSPEHGFRGMADAGESVEDSKDKETGIPIWSLYTGGRVGRPSAEQMRQIDVLLFDLQDVGLRFYTYYISMMRMMEAAAEHNKEMIILDRPNPNGFFVDGPTLDMRHRSGVGAIPVPVVHGMTLGELALMINSQGWLRNGVTANITIIPNKNYTRQTRYRLPIPPSPNLPNMQSIYLYPSICLFEGTVVSLGRGTPYPFQVYGHPDFRGSTFSFTPRSVPGATNPPHLNRLCYGVDLRDIPYEVIWERGFDLSHVINAYRNLNIGERFFTPMFELLVGVDYIRRYIRAGKSAEEIREMWQDDVARFKVLREPYLLYPDE
jgi:uncharacterized protein YbbC (DUF1343 family)